MFVCFFLFVFFFFFFFFFFWGGGQKARPSSEEGPRGRHRNDFFPHHIYCADSKVKWGGGNGGGGARPLHSYTTAFTQSVTFCSHNYVNPSGESTPILFKFR